MTSPSRTLRDQLRARQQAQINAMSPHDRSARISFVRDQLMFGHNDALAEELAMLHSAESSAIIDEGMQKIREQMERWLA